MTVRSLIREALDLAADAASGAVEAAQLAGQTAVGYTEQIADQAAAAVIAAGGTPQQAEQARNEVLDDVL